MNQGIWNTCGAYNIYDALIVNWEFTVPYGLFGLCRVKEEMPMGMTFLRFTYCYCTYEGTYRGIGGGGGS
jgi:hypothetical protein